MLVAAAADEAARGWGNTWGLLAGGAIIYVIWRVDLHFRSKIQNPSPTPALPAAKRVKAKATAGVTDDDTPDTPEPEEGWWGRIVEVGGDRYRQFRQVMATGSHELPAGDDELDEDPEIDLALDDDEQEDEQEHPETIAEFIARVDTGNVSDGLIANALMRHYGVSESTARRRIRDVRAKRKGKLQNAG